MVSATICAAWRLAPSSLYETPNATAVPRVVGNPTYLEFQHHMEPAASRAARDPIGGVVTALNQDARGSSYVLVGRYR